MVVAGRPDAGLPAWPVRLLVVADLTGGPGAGAPAPVAGRTIDGLIRALEPALPAGPGIPRDIRPRSLADLAPDGLRAALASGDSARTQGPVLDALLHAPAFQAFEAAWRGLARLLAHVGEGAEVEVLDVGAQALRRAPDLAFQDGAADPLHRRTAILINAELGAAAGDGAFLRALAALAERHRTPVVLAAAPSLLGLRYAAHLPALNDPADRLDSAWGGAWRAFRATDAARWVALTVNHVLLRPPYTIEAGGHPESVSPSRPDDFLWGRGVWLAGTDMLRSARIHGHPLGLSGMFPERFHFDLPLWTWGGPGGTPVSSSLETSIDQDGVQRLVRAGLSPICEAAGPGSAVLPLLANAHRPDPRRIPVEGTLAHTLILARFVSALAAATSAVEAEPDDAAAGGLLASALRRALAPRLSDADGTALEVAVERPEGRRVARAALRGDLTGSGRSTEIELSIPLAGALA
jgi:hypothetical protein